MLVSLARVLPRLQFSVSHKCSLYSSVSPSFSVFFPCFFTNRIPSGKCRTSLYSSMQQMFYLIVSTDSALGLRSIQSVCYVVPCMLRSPKFRKQRHGVRQANDWCSSNGLTVLIVPTRGSFYRQIRLL
jgi:hypothetical protein